MSGAIMEKVWGMLGLPEKDEEETEDDYSDESDAEVEEETDEFEGLAIYSEDDFE